MSPDETNQLNKLLIDLMFAQDNVTHFNELGPEWKDATEEQKQKRDAAKLRVVNFVNGLCVEF